MISLSLSLSLYIYIYVYIGKTWPGDRGLKLREPCLSSEYQDSGLGEILPRVPFIQGFIPTFCTDVIPHRFRGKPLV